MPDLLRFMFEVLTNVFFIPALTPLASQRRHFALFVGVAQLVASICYNVSDYFESSLFIPSINWHFMSDVLTLTYACLVLIHLAAIEEEETNVVLRYTAFFLSWLFKYRDTWDSTIWETSLVAFFIGVVLYSHVTHEHRRRRFRMERLQKAIIVGAAGFVFFCGELLFAKTDAHRILMGLAHGAAGFAVFEFWNVLPPPPRGKKLDDAGFGMGASFV